MNISKPFLVMVELSSGNVLRFAEHTRSRAEKMMSYYLTDIPTTERATFYDGEKFISTVRAAGGMCTTITRPEKGAKFSWNDIGGWQMGEVCVNGVTTTRQGEPAYHMRDTQGEWTIVPAWALVPEAD